jgi:hypothetical protein
MVFRNRRKSFVYQDFLTDILDTWWPRRSLFIGWVEEYQGIARIVNKKQPSPLSLC